MTAIADDTNKVLGALKTSSKGKLVYDRHWDAEGRTQEIITDIKSQLSAISISPLNRSLASKESFNSSDYVSSFGTSEVPSPIEKSDKNDKLKERKKARKPPQSISINELRKTENLANRVEILKFEEERQQNVKEAVESRQKENETFLEETEQQAEEEIRMIRQRYALALMKLMNEYKSDYESLQHNINAKQALMQKELSTSATHKLKEIESKHKLIVAEQEKKIQEGYKLELMNMKKELDKIAKDIKENLKSVEIDIKSPAFLQTIQTHQHNLNQITQNVDILLSKSRIEDNEVAQFKTYKLIAEKIEKEILTAIERNKTTQQLISQKPLEEKQQPFPEKDSVNDFQEKDLRNYLELQKFLNDFEESLTQFVNVTEFKTYRNSLQQFVKTTINTIASGSVDHLRDKLNRLKFLFEGKTLEFQEKRIDCKGHKDALNFCLITAAKTFVSVGTKQCVSVPKAAFPMAAVIGQLWVWFPTFGKIFFAHLQQKCPYVVPFYPNKDLSEDERTYLITCGYNFGSDGATVESDESFLNRMRALIRIYAAVIQTNFPTDHPYDLHNGWTWLAKIVQLPSKPGLTAAVMHAFLSVTTHKLDKHYRGQFRKLILFINQKFVPRIEEESKNDPKKQSLAQLKIFLNDTIRYYRRNTNPPPPEGLVSQYFFQSSFLFSRSVNL